MQNEPEPTEPPNPVIESYELPVKQNFVYKLFMVLENSANSNTIDWSPVGTSFIIKDIHHFSNSILPETFRHSKYMSFVRQLNMYGFIKVNRNANFDDDEPREFFHAKFIRGRKDLLPSIVRKTNTKQLNLLNGNNSSSTMSENSTQRRFRANPDHTRTLSNSGSSGSSGNSPPQIVDLGEFSQRQNEMLQTISVMKNHMNEIVAQLQNLRERSDFQMQYIERHIAQCASSGRNVHYRMADGPPYAGDQYYHPYRRPEHYYQRSGAAGPAKVSGNGLYQEDYRNHTEYHSPPASVERTGSGGRNGENGGAVDATGGTAAVNGANGH